MDSESRTVYVKRFIKTADDLPKETGGYFVFHSTFGVQGEFYNNDLDSKVKWLECFDYWLEPVEMPTEEEQIIYFNNHSAAIEIKPSGLKLPLMTRSEVLKFANWLLSKLTNNE